MDLRGGEQENLNALSVDELQLMLEERSKVADALKYDIDALKAREPHVQEQRLNFIEASMAGLDRGSDVKIHAPLLKGIHQAMLQEHREEHSEALGKLMQRYSPMDDADNKLDDMDRHPYDPYMHADHSSFVLGRGYLPLDNHHLVKGELMKIKDKGRHPVVEELHYAGNISRPSEDVKVAFVKEGGILRRERLWPTAYRGEFWLSLDGHKRSQHDRQLQAIKEKAEDPIAQRAMQYDTPGAGEDFYPIDWLGKLKRGDYEEEDHDHSRWKQFENKIEELARGVM